VWVSFVCTDMELSCSVQNTIVTISGKNFGSLRALELFGRFCANSDLRACTQV
jgi:hypothetical protein